MSTWTDSSICTGTPAAGAYENLDPATGERLATGVATLLGPTDTVALQVGYNGDDTRDDAVGLDHSGSVVTEWSADREIGDALVGRYHPKSHSQVRHLANH